MSDINWKITPPELLNRLGWTFRTRGKWLVLQRCPFCEGGDHGDRDTFIVHSVDGNYNCSRSKCGSTGTFWGLLLETGHNVYEYLGDRPQSTRSVKPKKKGFVYGR